MNCLGLFCFFFFRAVKKDFFRLRSGPFNFFGSRLSLMGPWGVLPKDLGGGVRRASGNSYPISDLTQNLIPYFRPDPSPSSFALTFEDGFTFPTLIKPQFFGEEN